MSTTSFFRRPTYRAPSPPTWACYEQIPYGDDGSSDSDSDGCASDASDAEDAAPRAPVPVRAPADADAGEVHNMDIDAEGDADAQAPAGADGSAKKDVKGKGRAVEPAAPEPPQAPKTPSPRKRRARPEYNPRPILTIHKSQGFVWNQDLFVPPHIKDRYVASTSPPNAKGFMSGSWSSTESSLGGYEVEVVEIRVDEGDLKNILPAF